MSSPVKDFYNSNTEREGNRLQQPLGRIEFLSTMRLIDRYFPEQGHIADIGAGPGRYAVELLRRGYRVTLFDLADEGNRWARAQLSAQGLAAERVITGDARDMSSLASASFDAALLLGPLYHIIQPEERVAVLNGLVRILKPGGAAIIAYLNTWGILRAGLTHFVDWYRDIDALRSMLQPRSFAGDALPKFTESYWATPGTALAEVKSAGLTVVSYAGAEGFAGGMGLLLDRLAVEEPEAFANVVQVAAESCELAQYRDSTEHVHIVVRKEGR